MQDRSLAFHFKRASRRLQGNSGSKKVTMENRRQLILSILQKVNDIDM